MQAERAKLALKRNAIERWENEGGSLPASKSGVDERRPNERKKADSEEQDQMRERPLLDRTPPVEESTQ